MNIPPAGLYLVAFGGEMCVMEAPDDVPTSTHSPHNHTKGQVKGSQGQNKLCLWALNLGQELQRREISPSPVTLEKGKTHCK